MSLFEKITGIKLPEPPKPSEREMAIKRRQKIKNILIFIAAIIFMLLYMNNFMGIQEKLSGEKIDFSKTIITTNSETP